MNNEKSLVSIIMPNYNSSRFIEESIKSILAQTYTNWELLIQDDMSNDKSLEIALKYEAKDSRIKVESNNKNLGAALTRNNAILRSRGEYLAFLDSDDLWLPEKLEWQLQFMKQHNCDFSFTRYQLITENGKRIPKVARIVKNLTYKKYLFHCWTGCLTVMYRQDKNAKIFSYNIKNNNDYGLFLQVIKKCKNAMGINEILAFYRIRNKSLSRNKFKKIKPFFQLMCNYEHHSLIVAIFFLFTNQLIKKVWKYKRIKPLQNSKNSNNLT